MSTSTGRSRTSSWWCCFPFACRRRSSRQRRARRGSQQRSSSAQGRFLLAAILVQAKTVLDNADGQLARLSGRITAFGRYLDSELDLFVNAALFAAVAVAHRTARRWPPRASSR